MMMVVDRGRQTGIVGLHCGHQLVVGQTIQIQKIWTVVAVVWLLLLLLAWKGEIATTVAGLLETI